MHELMHAAGFWHEQSRADRDDYISINWSNIRAGMEFNFLKYDLRKIDHLGAEYDTCSVMHYVVILHYPGPVLTLSLHSDDQSNNGRVT